MSRKVNSKSSPPSDSSATDQGSISLWIRKLKEGDAQAAQGLWKRYYRRLVGLARMKLHDSPRAVTDEEDVVQNAFTSFVLRAQKGLFPDLRDRENLWPLLVLITARKATNQRKHEKRVKRGAGRVRNEAVDDSEGAEFAQVIADEPSPEEAVAFFDELEKFMDALEDPSQRLILLWKLQDRTNPEMARHLNCSLSAVERKLRAIRKRLSEE
jgi:RNA polymerase sigma factor (sigma-70 family)